MSGRKPVYYTAVIATAVGMFLPLLYGSLGWVRELLGSNPLLKSLALIVAGWLIAYVTFEEEGKETGEGLTVS
ncbi:hypothetical protein [Thermococcus sp.]